MTEDLATETMARMVSRMSADTARELRDKLDKTPAVYLPGAEHLGAMRALGAYRVFRPLLTARIELAS